MIDLAPGWAEGPLHPTISEEEVHVWLMPLGAPPATEIPPLDVLSADEALRARTADSEIFRHRFVQSRSALRHLLARYLGAAPAEIAFEQNDFGRPSLVPPFRGALDFNLSHADRWVAFAFARGRRVGVDLERLDREVAWRAVAASSFSALERGQLDGQTDDAAGARAFLRGWTRKEAYAKARGEGFAYGFSRFSVSLAEPLAGVGLLEDQRDPDAVRRWWIRDLDVEPLLAASLAGEGEYGTIRCWRYTPA